MPSDNNANKEERTDSPGQRVAGFSRQFATAMELPFIMVATIGVGGVIGHFLDNWLHTKPYLMLLLGTVGFFAGLRDMLRRAAKQ
ncbi:MAG: AtpZ/AtpI family protein [Candidatus Acidiferrum sp.]